MVKSMVENLGALQKLDSPRKQRFPDRFLEDISRLVGFVTTEILFRQRRDGKDSRVSNYFYSFVIIYSINSFIYFYFLFFNFRVP